jgi:LysM repeat protein
LGRHRKPSRIRLPHGATAAAAPTLATVAAAICLSPQATPVANAAEAHVSLSDAASHASSASAPAETTAHLTTRGSAAALPATYKVRSGDSLSSIAARLYHDRADWPVLYWRNHNRIHWADDIYAGQVLRVPPKPARAPHAPADLAPPQPAATVQTTLPVQITATASAAGAVSAAADQVTTASSAGSYPGGAFGACVVAHESGGNAQIMNSTGHYGLYQFSESTWVAYGGSPADFGHASVAEQNQVFANALAAGGESNWAPYDGC